jgi:hypothetical protein
MSLHMFTRTCKYVLLGVSGVKWGRKNGKNVIFRVVDNPSVHNILLQVGDAEFLDPGTEQRQGCSISRISPHMS